MKKMFYLLSVLAIIFIGCSSLHNLVIKNDSDGLKKKIGKDTDINQRDADYRTPLMYAAINGNIEIARLLIEKGADVNAKDNEGETAKEKIQENDRVTPLGSLFRIFSSNSKNIKKVNRGYTPLLYASANGHLEMIKELINNKANINITDTLGANALMVTAAFSSSKDTKKVIQFFINKGLSINSEANDGSTALYGVIRNGNDEISNYLVSRGANKERTLLYAAARGSSDVIEKLIQYKVNINCKDKHGWTPLTYAKYHNHEDAADVITKAGGRDYVDAEKIKSVMREEARRSAEIEKTACMNFFSDYTTDSNTCYGICKTYFPNDNNCMKNCCECWKTLFPGTVCR